MRAQTLARRGFLRLSAGLVASAATALSTRQASAAAPGPFQAQIRMYHEIDYSMFKAELLGLLDAGFQPISVETIVAALNGTVLVPAGSNAFHITWDDSRLSQYTDGWRAIKDIQQERGVFIPVTAFMLTMFDHLPASLDQVPNTTPCYTELGPALVHHKYFTKGQAIELIRNGVHAGSHTVDHADLPRLSIGGIDAQLVTAEQRIQGLWDAAGVERPVRVFAYPYGDFNSSIVAAVQSLGYDAAFSTIGTTVHSPRDRFILGRVGSVESSAGLI